MSLVNLGCSSLQRNNKEKKRVEEDVYIFLFFSLVFVGKDYDGKRGKKNNVYVALLFLKV